MEIKMDILNYISESKSYEIKRITKDICIPENESILNAYNFLVKNDFDFCCISDSLGSIKGLIYKDDIEKIKEINDTRQAVDFLRKDFLFIYDRSIANLDIDYRFYAQPHRYALLTNKHNDIKGIIIYKKPLMHTIKDNPVIIMAGGLGMRLRPYTEKIPKPLLKIDGISILERILIYFRYYGFRNFYISVNYLANKIKDIIGDGSWLGVDVQYIHEKTKLGTAGALSLIERPDSPCLVSNGDLLMDADLDALLSAHKNRNAICTMCTYTYTYKIPYGVIQSHNGKYQNIVEKPTQSFQVNTGLYCLNPSVWDYLNKEEPLDMPTLFEKIHSDTDRVYIYSHSGKWVDIGTTDVYEKLLNS